MAILKLTLSSMVKENKTREKYFIVCKSYAHDVILFSHIIVIHITLVLALHQLMESPVVKRYCQNTQPRAGATDETSLGSKRREPARPLSC